MISASTEFLAMVNDGVIPSVRILLTLSDGTTQQWIENGDIWADSLSISEATSSDSTFDVGSAVISGFNFSLNNFDGTYTDIDFSGATVAPVFYYTIDGTAEYLSRGVYYVASHRTSGNIIQITSLDAMKFLDNADTTITYPITVQSLVETLCTASGITLATTTIPNGSFEIPDPSENTSESFTDRQKLSYACQLIGCYAKINELGYLEVAWYDFDNPVSITSTFDGKSLFTDTIEVTGVYIEVSTDTDTTGTLYGTDDRVINVTQNPYVTSDNMATVYANISANIFEKTFRPGTLPVLANPCLQAGDVLQVTDNITGNVYLLPVTSLTYNKTLIENAICTFEEKEESDLRPSSSYSMKTSVASAISQAQAADALAQAAQEMAETSGYQPYIISDKGTAFTTNTTATLTAIIYDSEMNEVDPDGTTVIYRWWVTKDGVEASYLNGGKIIEVPIDDSLCDFAAGIYFETKDISEGVNPFLLSRRGDTVILTNRAGTPLSARAADEVITS